MTFFLRDDKVYFMSSGIPRDKRHADDKDKTTRQAAGDEAPKK